MTLATTIRPPAFDAQLCRWRDLCEWEEEVLFPVFDQLAGRDAGCFTSALSREHGQMEWLASKGEWEHFDKLLQANRRHKHMVVYAFLNDRAESLGWSLDELLESYWKIPLPPRPRPS
ncbi:MAG: hypothetical protein AB7S38_14990 [Vulcanimicrobiota bacterium]